MAVGPIRPSPWRFSAWKRRCHVFHSSPSQRKPRMPHMLHIGDGGSMTYMFVCCAHMPNVSTEVAKPGPWPVGHGGHGGNLRPGQFGHGGGVGLGRPLDADDVPHVPPHVHRPQGLKAYPMAANLLENQARGEAPGLFAVGKTMLFWLRSALEKVSVSDLW
ncbi:unnamed protein product [Durusdinium trenchii]|uniref:Uncharacterized protein n=1 Tax=Durusdinium trenchii TaxID=1381693 RepID=A0ABP0MDS4_9DINO